MLKVCKFGGTSLSCAENIKNACGIVKADETRRYVVVSAPGKRSSNDIKVTDLLIACGKAVIEKGNCVNEFKPVKERFKEIVNALKVELDIDGILQETENSIVENNGDMDFVASRGEYLNARIVAAYLNFEFVDAMDIIKFDGDGKFSSEYTEDLVRMKLAKKANAVIPGFYGRMPNGKIKTFSRGGSDVSGSIIAGAVEADIYENWTDVDGFMVADPRIVENPEIIEVLSYRELRELSYMGASVLHADSIFPVRAKNIPINVKNSFAPEKKGTMILPYSMYEKQRGKGIITGIAGKKDFTVIHIEKSMMNSELGFARKVLSVFERFGISFEHMPSGIDTLSIVVETSQINGREDTLVTKIREVVSPDNIVLQNNFALIATVGHNMALRKGTARRLFSAISDADVNIKMIDQGSSELNIIIGVENSDYEKAVKAIYNEFVD